MPNGRYYILAHRTALRWINGEERYTTEAEARAAITRPGRYRVKAITPTGRRVGESFLMVGKPVLRQPGQPVPFYCTTQLTEQPIQ